MIRHLLPWTTTTKTTTSNNKQKRTSNLRPVTTNSIPNISHYTSHFYTSHLTLQTSHHTHQNLKSHISDLKAPADLTAYDSQIKTSHLTPHTTHLTAHNTRRKNQEGDFTPCVSPCTHHTAQTSNLAGCSVFLAARLPDLAGKSLFQAGRTHAPIEIPSKLTGQSRS